MDILAIRDDGNDPLRPLIANACDWMEKARLDGGKVLVHCVSSFSRTSDRKLTASVSESVEVLVLS
jgi:dual specificity MAP kinase phosphatase